MPDNRIIYALQKGLPLVQRPFAALAKRLGVSEKDVLVCLGQLADSGRIRRFGGVFDAGRLGFRSVLCAVSTRDRDHLEEVAAELVTHPGITHCYRRKPSPNFQPPGGEGGKTVAPCPDLWFTLSVPADRYDRQVSSIQACSGCDRLLFFPGVRRFKVEVVFDTRDEPEKSESAGLGQAVQVSLGLSPSELSPGERRIVQLLQDSIAPCPYLYQALAAQVGISESDLLATLHRWKSDGILRRIAPVLYHRQMGYRANAMCVWQMAQADTRRAGKAVAADHRVTHCYERASHSDFPYNLFAMVHAFSWPAVDRLFLELTRKIGGPPGMPLRSVTEFKKTSLRYID